MPAKNSSEWFCAVARLSELLKKLKPDLVLLPWRRDPHCDHRASYSLAKQAMQLHPLAMTLEYAIWLDEFGAPEDHPRANEAIRLELDVRLNVLAKKRAIAAHLTQTTRLIEDDPTGFLLSPKTITRLTGPVEYYWQDINAAH